MHRTVSPFWRGFLVLLLLGGGVGFRPIHVEPVGRQDDVAIKGYDTVAYFTEGRAVRGRAILQVRWQGARWYFSSPEHRRLFRANPERYAPAYGGYCAFCVSESGDAVTGGDPEVFLIHEQKLYLLQSEAVRRDWLKDPDAHAERAREVYARLLRESQADRPAG